MKNNAKTQNTEKVLINKTTLNAIKQMMFGKIGTDLTNIVNDVAMGVEDDLAAINVALAFQGFKPEFDRTPKFQGNWRGYSKHEVMSVSLITGFARVHITSYHYEKETDSFTLYEENEMQVPYEMLDQLSEDEEKVKEEAKK